MTTMKGVIRSRTSGRYLPLVFLVLAVLIMAGCASRPDRPVADTLPAVGSSRPAATPSMEQRLRTIIDPWIGTPHRLGGVDRSGVDCSGFVQRIYYDLFGIRLPRTTAAQAHHGQPIQVRSLQTGDLVFFLPPRSVRHVGIYLGDGQFAHASKSRGVMLSRMDDLYWRSAYWTARRILSPNG